MCCSSAYLMAEVEYSCPPSSVARRGAVQVSVAAAPAVAAARMRAEDPNMTAALVVRPGVQRKKDRSGGKTLQGEAGEGTQRGHACKFVRFAL